MNGGEEIIRVDHHGGLIAAAAGVSVSSHNNVTEREAGSGSCNNLQANNGSASTAATSASAGGGPATLSRYEAQKSRDWNTFGQYLRNHRPPLSLARCSGPNVLEFLRYLDQFGKTKVHVNACAYFGLLHPPSPCSCPLRQAWGSLDALIGRLRAAYDEHGGKPETNPFGARAVRNYLREVRELQAKARGISHKKKRKPRPAAAAAAVGSGSAASFQPVVPSGPPPLPPPSATSSSILDVKHNSVNSHVLNHIHLVSVHEQRYHHVDSTYPDDSHLRLILR